MMWRRGGTFGVSQCCALALAGDLLRSARIAAGCVPGQAHQFIAGPHTWSRWSPGLSNQANPATGWSAKSLDTAQAPPLAFLAGQQGTCRTTDQRYHARHGDEDPQVRRTAWRHAPWPVLPAVVDLHRHGAGGFGGIARPVRNQGFVKAVDRSGAKASLSRGRRSRSPVPRMECRQPDTYNTKCPAPSA